jgi:BlaI family penicillinase repressor
MVRISDAEIEVMKVIWEKKEVTSLEIIRELESHNWNDNTVRTLINRLISKKAVGISKKEGKTYTYVPLIKENEYKVKRTKNFIKQLYNGSLNDMLLNFVDSNELSKSDLRELLDQIEDRIK